MRPASRRTRCAVGAAVMLLAAACQSGSTSPTTVTQEVSAEITAETTEFEFSPSSWEVPADAAVTLTLDNQGTMEHTFTVVTEGGRVSSSAELGEVEPVARVEAGATTTASFTAPSQPDSYQVVCTIPGHLEAGMEATLTVTQP